MIEIDTKAFIQTKFGEYYGKSSASVPPPTSIEKREFGFLLMKERVMLRHRSFKTPEELRDSLKRLVPSNVYYSSAYYERPEEKMDEKGWIGADLVFDIDADHIPTPCAKNHDTWTCANCSTTGLGRSPEKCPTCKGQRFEEKAWPCEVCLESAKQEIMKLIDILTKDFGLSTKEMTLGFSGHRGYHLHVERKEILTLDSMSRKEIVDYILGIGLEPGMHGLREHGSLGIAGPNLNDLGWKGRIAQGTYDFLRSATPAQLEKIGLGKETTYSLSEHKDSILKSWEDKGPWGAIRGVGTESWGKIVEQAVKRQASEIDTVVTTDIHRLIRLTNTLHGKTGLRKTGAAIAGIEKFDPLKRAVAFPQGSATIFVSEAPEFRIGDNFHGPYRNERVELPMAAALFLLCKGAAGVVEEGSSVR